MDRKVNKDAVMKNTYSKVFQFIFAGIFLFLSACNSSTDITPTSTTFQAPIPSQTSTTEPNYIPEPTLTTKPSSTPSPTTTPSPIQVSEHRIGIRYVNGMGEFYNKEDDSKFVPRGMNYARIDHVINGNDWHSTFDPALYDPKQIDQALQQMESDGFNLVRVFIDCCSAAGEQVGNPIHGLSYPYTENVVDFLKRAKSHHIYVILITDLTPGLGGYNDLLWKAGTAQIGGNNPRYLTVGGSIAKANYETDFVRVLIEHQAPMDAIFAYDLTNEVNFDTSMPPFSLSNGLVTTGNGKSYDMAKPDDKVRMAYENLIYWIDHQRESIRQLDPTALVEVSFYAPMAPVPSQLGDSYISLTGEVIAQSQVDFIDLHPYPGVGFDLSQYARYYGIDANTPKPILMGEFGAFKYAFDAAADAAQFLQNWQIESCQYGFDGWLLWTWDTEDRVWNALSQNHEIEKALAPTNRPDPCR